MDEDESFEPALWWPLEGVLDLAHFSLEEVFDLRDLSLEGVLERGDFSLAPLEEVLDLGTD